MKRKFNVTGLCVPELNYMVDTSRQVSEIRHLVDEGSYFTINCARQYGKTTTLAALARDLSDDYIVINMDFQMFGSSAYKNENKFSLAFASCFLEEFPPDKIKGQGTEAFKAFEMSVANADNRLELFQLFKYLQKICMASEKPVILIADEVDSAANNQVFLDFLAQLRGYYLMRTRNGTPSFQSVILASVYDIKNMKNKMVQDKEYKTNSPWNIAAYFNIEMSFDKKGIAGMVKEYEEDYHTGMDIDVISSLIYDYTSGYPFLVSKICKLIDEYIPGKDGFPDKKSAWTKDGFLLAVKILLEEPNTLFESLLNKLEDYKELGEMLVNLLFRGMEIVYSFGIPSIEMALIFGFVKKSDNNIIIANRIFETFLYNSFLGVPEMQGSKIFDAAIHDKNQFIQNGRLNMELLKEL